MDPMDGIYDDGEWNSWDEINGWMDDAELKGRYPGATLEQARLFEDLVAVAYNYKLETGRYLQIWGELGELYAEVKYGIRRLPPGTPGSDGRLGNDWIEIKTISPEKGTDTVHVKLAGNFNKLLVVRISDSFEFAAKFVARKSLDQRSAKQARLSWSAVDG